jgi:hypothetical protein
MLCQHIIRAARRRGYRRLFVETGSAPASSVAEAFVEVTVAVPSPRLVPVADDHGNAVLCPRNVLGTERLVEGMTYRQRYLRGYNERTRLMSSADRPETPAMSPRERSCDR